MSSKNFINYPQAWYPLMKSNQLRKKNSLAIKAFEKDWLLYRDENNQVALISRYCCHMGVDLINGKIVNGCIECPLHGWHFDKNGQCCLIPALVKKESDNKKGYKKAKKQRKLTSLVCEEAYGLIYTFLGDTPTYDIPLPPGMESVKYGRGDSFTLNTESHVPCLNTFDLQHYQSIHHRQFIQPPIIESANPDHLGISMNLKIVPTTLLDKLMQKLVNGSATINIDCWGASLLLMKNDKTGFGAVISMLPVEQYQCRLFIVPIKEKSKNQGASMRIREYISLGIALKMIRGFLLADNPVLNGMHSVEGYLLDGIDNGVKRYWQYWRELPRYSLAESELFTNVSHVDKQPPNA